MAQIQGHGTVGSLPWARESWLGVWDLGPGPSPGLGTSGRGAGMPGIGRIPAPQGHLDPGPCELGFAMRAAPWNEPKGDLSFMSAFSG